MEMPLTAEELATQFEKEMGVNGGGRLYAYKETYFTGFAPCFEDNLYTLACCKGNKKNGGLRRQVCEWIKADPEQHSAWLLSIAGQRLEMAGHNKSCFESYTHKDLITLVRIKGLAGITTWAKYSGDYSGRSDSIYRLLDDGTMEHRGISDEHREEHLQDTDLARCMKDYPNVQQILLSRQYIVFSDGHKLPEERWGALSHRSISKDAICGAVDVIVDIIRSDKEAVVSKSPFTHLAAGSGKSACGKKKEGPQ